MDQLDQIQIIQEIVNRVISVADPHWSELMITYYVDEEQSQFANSYLVNVEGSVREKPLRTVNDLDKWLRRLRTELARGGEKPFSSCKLHLLSDGKFSASYGYDELDWEALVKMGWNFPDVTSLH
ncbi:immunity protein YezG family protein [Pseudoduganella sp. S-14]|uniref:immunity protein YezG family protein n=1 Tax=Pseudoduganella sp. S-14 TaxID=3404065 RepID=UPI003CF3BEA0